MELHHVIPNMVSRALERGLAEIGIDAKSLKSRSLSNVNIVELVNQHGYSAAHIGYNEVVLVNWLP